MYLHEYSRFLSICEVLSNSLSIRVEYVIKDYYVFTMLKLIRSKSDIILFKGGTSLSKGWRILNRFSEDIDLNIIPEIPSTDSSRMKLVNSVRESMKELGLIWDNSLVAARKEYNSIDAYYSGNGYSDNLKIETMANKKGKLLNVTYTELPISSYIWDYFCNSQYAPILIQCNMQPFGFNVQNMDVTFVEKMMSLANNYLRGTNERVSRHMYDIYCMGTYGNLLSFNLPYTIQETKKYLLERHNDRCLQVDKNGKYASQILYEAISSDFYYQDFMNSTMNLKLKEDPITYEMCKSFLLNLLNNIGTF